MAKGNESIFNKKRETSNTLRPTFTGKSSDEKNGIC